VFLLLAVLAPFVCTTLYLAIMQGRAVHSDAIHQTLLVLIACSCIPFVCWLPFTLLVRMVLAVFLAVMLYIIAEGYGIWAACVLFHSCM
jgi:hypothetical protein